MKCGSTRFSLVLLLPCRFALTAIAAFFSLSAAVGLIGIDNLAFRTYTSPLMLEFVFGCVIGTFYQKGMVLSVRSSGALFASGAVLLLLSLSLSIGPVVDPAERVIIWGVPSAMFVMGAIFLERAGAWRTNRIIEALGDSSYSLYLGHYPLLFVLIVLAGKLDPGHRTPGDVVWMMFFALACMFGYITHRTVERPIELLLRGRLAIKRATTAPGIAPVS
jgi:exopolysaccharide production protein ExoZ